MASIGIRCAEYKLVYWASHDKTKPQAQLPVYGKSHQMAGMEIGTAIKLCECSSYGEVQKPEHDKRICSGTMHRAARPDPTRDEGSSLLRLAGLNEIDKLNELDAINEL